MRFDTKPYELVHGKKPKGAGRWAFGYTSREVNYFSPCMTLTQAKKWALEQMQDPYMTVIYIHG